MTTLTLKAPLPNHTYATRGGVVTSDANGIITEVAVASQLFQDLMAVGASVVADSAPAASISDPIE